ncbi:MAG: bifunctional hydroxymethylpyrimidine kinase/phosphomethylpyrimidine kinase [Eubacterium sp.]|nr:bifunctional hydroxymethylpyrimidine kinase/phosphomethylpyrimidine kinase [Eubacterium sp.]
MKAVLTVAGSDCSGGAGIQADLKTILSHGAYGMSVITALTAQNTTGVSGIAKVEAEFIGMQMDAVFTDLVPDAVKIGMIQGAQAVHVVSQRLRKYAAKQVVIDPVLASTSGTRLMEEEALECALEELFPLAALLTPNIPEAEVLTGISIKNADDMQLAAKAAAKRFGCAVLCKGGHLAGAADDLLYDGGQFYWMRAQRISNPNTHGTGCTLSAAAACGLAEGRKMPDAVLRAKEYVAGAILDGLDLGAGRGPLNHGYQVFKTTVEKE